MGISPPSDLVLDVVRNADPAAARQAIEKLQDAARAARTTKADDVTEAFQDRLSASQPKSASPSTAIASAVATKPDVSESLTTLRVKHQPDAKEQLTAFVMKTFVEAMLPKDSEALFGSGSAGEFWRSMMADKIAEQLAESVDLGLFPEEQAGAAKVSSDGTGLSVTKPVDGNADSGWAVKTISNILSDVQATESARGNGWVTKTDTTA